jgi:hypothetical protein
LKGVKSAELLNATSVIPLIIGVPQGLELYRDFRKTLGLGQVFFLPRLLPEFAQHCICSASQ